MARKKTTQSAKEVMADYRHDEAKRKNNPPAKIAAEGSVPPMPKIEYAYSPRLPPVLRFDPTGAPDKLPELLEQARQRSLTEDELRLLSDHVIGNPSFFFAIAVDVAHIKNTGQASGLEGFTGPFDGFEVGSNRSA